MSKRLQKFKELENCPIHRSMYRRLKTTGYDFISDYIKKHDHLDKHQFAKLINMIYLDDPNKPTNHATVWAILTAINH